MASLDEFAELLRRPQQRELLAYWRSKAAAGKLPGRQDIDPIEMTALLPWIGLFDVTWEDGRPRFRFRLVGTAIVQRYGRDATGLWFEEAYQGDILARQTATFSAIATSGRPHLDSLSAPVAGKEFVTSHRLILPLASDGKTVDHMIALILFDDTKPKTKQ